ncbi:20S proteasome subunit alpha 2 [Fistulifera solaris]|uniref:20S proteasome subunit alpha 2 n=1 Tax=Fistulifera solaris TaxID=1519565 RepID=A0A1Z5KN27_FISSO|nr:20S proteasome subunit alpha 2 [Fistulifera solaris]|eukprot:GAX27567.1 20S proteasome subunit alpha 2 [Fistulifera solaris]
MGDSAYSFSLTTFSRTGKLLQIEYALNAVANGRTALGICAQDGVVIATDKKLPSVLVDPEHVQKIEKITPKAGFCYAGVGPDYRVLVKRSRKSSQSYLSEYGEVQPVHQLVTDTASTMQEYTQRGGVRPFGISLLVAGLDSDGKPALFQVDPSGSYFGWNATAIGKNYVSAKNFLEKRWTEDMELEDAIHTALLTLREGFEGEMTAHNIELGIVKKDGEFQVLQPSQIQDYLDEAN